MNQTSNIKNLEALEMSTKRDHKVFITDDAIKKVPFIKYREIPEEDYAIIHMLAKKVLQLSKENNNSNEVAITYSLDNEIPADDDSEYFGIDYGDEHSADPLRDPYSCHLIYGSKSCVIISLHNHPSLSKISLPDVRFFLSYPSIRMLVVVTNLGNISYLVKSDKYQSSQAVNIFNEAVAVSKSATGLKILQEASNYFLNNCYKAGIIYDDR